MKHLSKVFRGEVRPTPGPWAEKPREAAELAKALYPFLRKDYRPPDRRSTPHEKLRHRFISAMNLDVVYTPRVARLDPRTGRLSVGKTSKINEKLIDNQKLGFRKTLQPLEDQTRHLRPRSKISQTFYNFQHNARELCHISHMVVRFGIKPGLGIIQDLRALSRLFWRVEWNSKFHFLARRVRKKVSTSLVESDGLSTKPVRPYIGDTKTRFKP